MAHRIMAIGTTAPQDPGGGIGRGGALRGLLGICAGWVIVASCEALFLLPPVLQVFRRVPLTTTPGRTRDPTQLGRGDRKRNPSKIRSSPAPEYDDSLRLVTTPRGSAPRSASRLIVDTETPNLPRGLDHRVTSGPAIWPSGTTLGTDRSEPPHRRLGRIEGDRGAHTSEAAQEASGRCQPEHLSTLGGEAPLPFLLTSEEVHFGDAASTHVVDYGRKQAESDVLPLWSGEPGALIVLAACRNLEHEQRMATTRSSVASWWTTTSSNSIPPAHPATKRSKEDGN